MHLELAWTVLSVHSHSTFITPLNAVRSSPILPTLFHGSNMDFHLVCEVGGSLKGRSMVPVGLPLKIRALHELCSPLTHVTPLAFLPQESQLNTHIKGLGDIWYHECTHQKGSWSSTRIAMAYKCTATDEGTNIRYVYINLYRSRRATLGK